MEVTDFPSITAGISTVPPQPWYPVIVTVWSALTVYTHSPELSALATITLPNPKKLSPISAGKVNAAAIATAAANAVILFICFFILSLPF